MLLASCLPTRRLVGALAVASVCALLLVAVPGTARAATTYHVSPSGRNVAATDGGGTSQRPFRSLGFAIRHLDPGDTLLVRGSARTPYVENVGTPASTPQMTAKYTAASATRRITVRAAAGHRPWIKGVLHIRRASYWTIRGINVRRNPDGKYRNDPLVKLMDGVGWRFENARVEGARSYAGVYVGDSPDHPGPRGWRITGSCIARNGGDTSHAWGQDHNLYVAAGLGNRGGLVARNIMFGAPRGHNVKIGVGRSNTTDGTAYVKLRYNTMFHGLSNVIVVGKSNHVVMERNLLGRTGARVSGNRQHAWYPNFRGYKLTGGANVARYNYGFEAAKVIDGGGIRNGGGNRLARRPSFNNVTNCGGFRPATKVPYGRYG